MTKFKSDFLRVLEARGFIQDVTEPEALDKLLASETVTAYIGFDATATSLHAGSLIPIMMLYWLQETGHKPIVLLGGGTTKVGDPSGKEEMRQVLTEERILDNVKGISGTFERVLTKPTIVNNDEWLSGLNYIEFLRDIGRHFTINRMLTMDSVKLRLDREQPLSFIEFNYMIMQAYDFVELNKRYGCRLQMGGSDQWGNIVNGIDLGRRIADAHLFGITTPLLTTSSGKKMGKTAEGAVWLNADLLSTNDYWQYWRNTEDGDVGRFLRLFTKLHPNEIERLEKLEGAEINDAKKILATEATAVIHGRAEAEKALKTAEETFEGSGRSQNLKTIHVAQGELKAESASLGVKGGDAEFHVGLGLLTALVRAELASTNSEARRLVKGGGVKVNDKTVTDEKHVLTSDDVDADGAIKLSVGRKRHALIRPV